MEVSYVRNYLQSYMVICTNADKNYEGKIIEENALKGILPVQINYLNQSYQYMYDISSRLSLRDWLDKKKFVKKDIINLCTGLLEVMEEIKEYLLNEDNIILNPEYIFVDLNGGINYCYYPFCQKNFFEELKQLFEYILGNIEHGDKETVLAAYGIYQNIIDKKFDKDILKEKKAEVIVKEEAWEEQEKTQNTVVENATDSHNKIIIGTVVCAIIGVAAFFIKVLLVKLIIWSVAAYGVWILWKKKEDKPKDVEEIIWSEEYISTKENQEEIEYTKLLTKENKPFFKSLSNENENIILNKNEIVIGSIEKYCDYVINDSTVSRMHVKYECKEGRHYIKDMNSKNGTRVNQKLLMPNEIVELNEGDQVEISRMKYCFYLG